MQRGIHARARFRGLGKRTKIAAVAALTLPLIAAGTVAANAVTEPEYNQGTKGNRVAAVWFDVCVSQDGRNVRFILEHQSCGGKSIHYRWPGSKHPKFQNLAKDGKSAYEIAVELGFEGTEDEWLASLKGEQGEKGEKGDKGDKGEQGPDGAVGPQGEAGAAGKSAYEIAVENGFEGTEDEWLASLKGEKGDPGEPGPQGPPGGGGLSGYDLVSRETPIERLTENATFEVTCPDGKTALGGGFIGTGDGASGIVAHESGPILVDGAATGWRVRASNFTDEDAQVTVHATCATLPAEAAE